MDHFGNQRQRLQSARAELFQQQQRRKIAEVSFIGYGEDRAENEEQCAHDVDLWRNADPRGTDDPRGEHGGLPGDEAGDDVVVNRQREGEQGTREDRRKDQRKRDLPERNPGRRPQVPGSFLQAGVELSQSRPDNHRHHRQIERRPFRHALAPDKPGRGRQQRGENRRQDLAVRRALGARRADLVRSQVTEALLLAVVGGAVGALIAWSGVPLLVRAAPDAVAGGFGGAPIPGLASARLDLTALLFTPIAIELAHGDVAMSAVAIHARVARVQRNAAREDLDRVSITPEVRGAASEPDDRVGIRRRFVVRSLRLGEVRFEECAGSCDRFLKCLRIAERLCVRQRLP